MAQRNDFQSMVNCLPDAAVAVVHDADGGARILLANDHAHVLLGRMAGTLIDAPLATLGPEADVLASAPASELRRTGRMMFRTDGGESIHCEVSWQDIDVDGQRAALALLRLASDHQLEERLSQRESRFSRAMQASQVGIYEHNHLTDPERAVYWSRLQRDIFGYPQDAQVSLQDFADIVHPADRERVFLAVSKSQNPDGDGIYDIEHRIIRPDGKVRWILSRGVTEFGVVNGSRIPVHTVGAVLDITAAKELAQAFERRAAILDATPDFVSVTDLKGQLVYLNRAGREHLGLSREEDISRLTMELAHTPEALRMIKDVAVPVVKSVGYWKGETEFLKHDGTVIPMSQVLLGHRSMDGELNYLSTIARDLSREKRLEEQFLQAQKMEAIGRLAGGVAHDFNNILSVIMGFASLASFRMSPGQTGKKEMDEIMKAAERAAGVTGQLLAFSRKQILQPRVLDLNSVVRDMTPMLQQIVGENVALHIDLASPTGQIKADPNQMEQILLNLVVNARDAMPLGGKLTIALQTTRLASSAAAPLDVPAGRYVMVSVHDSGAGMDDETREHIFEPFFTTKSVGHGTGLGLSTVFGIMRQSGGTVAVESERDRGTTFRLYFPRTDEALSVPPPELAPVRHGSGGVILVVEDDPQLRKVVVASLSRAGYTALEAETGEEALAILNNRDGAIDLLLTDVVMPRMSGTELARKLSGQYPDMAVLFMSGYTEDSILNHGVLDESVNLLKKPLTVESLLRKVGEVVRRSPGLDAASA